MIEQPKKQAGPAMAQWFYSLCSCGRLVRVTGGVIPEHEYSVTYSGYGVPATTRTYRCDLSLTQHSTHQ